MKASRWDLIPLPRTTAGTACGISPMAVSTSNVKRRKEVRFENGPAFSDPKPYGSTGEGVT
jgi:hypothetical protein